MKKELNREPSIHIRINRLESALLEAGLSVGDLEVFINSIIQHGRRDNLSHRSMLIDNKKMEKVATKTLTSTSSDADFFNQLLFLIRKKNHHRVRSKFEKGSREFTTIKKASELAIEFCNEFEFDRKEGFTKYINIFIQLSNGKTWLNNLVSKYEYYCSYYEAEILTNKDKNAGLTQDLINLFSREIMRVTGLTSENISIFEQANFVKASQLCIELGVSAKIYMSSQFEGLDFMGGIPHTTQLSGDKAKGRVIKYMAKHNLRSSEMVKSKLNWGNILGGKK